VNPPSPPPEGVLIESCRRDAGLSVREAAKRAGISEGWWRQVVKGYQSLSGGAFGLVRDVPAGTIARMAKAAQVPPGRLAAEGQRPDAARELEALAIAGAEWHPEPIAGAFTVSDIARAEPFAAELRMRYEELRASGIPDPSGADMWPQYDEIPAQAGFAAGWDIARRAAIGPGEADRVSQAIWLLALYQAERAARLHGENNADSALTAVTALPRKAAIPLRLPVTSA
jgi:transcriptional regulator with XRE-family HTH domain